MSLMERRDKLAEAVKRPQLRGQIKRMLSERMRAVRSSREQQEYKMKSMRLTKKLMMDTGDDSIPLQDYQKQLMFLDMQEKKRLLMARHEQDAHI